MNSWIFAPKRTELKARAISVRSYSFIWILLALFFLANIPPLLAQNDVPGDPSGNSGDFDGLETTGSGYDTYTGNVKRSITDMVVPGAASAFPLQFSRIYTSRYNAAPTDIKGHFGDANWRHSYQWEGQQTQNSSGRTVYQVGYPDGRVINFRGDRPYAAYDSFARGPVGTVDRFEISPANDSTHPRLHLADGSQVMFSIQSDKTLRAENLIDPYGATTHFVYGTYTPTYTINGTTYTQPQVSVLSQVFDPSGRNLVLSYTTLSSTYTSGGTTYVPYWVVISAVSWTDSGHTLHQDASYGYKIYGPSSPNEQGSTTMYAALQTVIYSEPTQANQQVYVQASYTYQASAAISSSNPLGTAPPLLVTCNDPYFTGPMHKIRYYYSNPSGAWGLLRAEENFGNSTPVSTLTQNAVNTPTYATITRGDNADANGTQISRGFLYGESSTLNTPTNAQGFQVTTSIDFQGNATRTYYTSQSDAIHGSGYVSQVTDPTGASTQYATEPFAGKIVQVTLPNGSTRKTNWGGLNGENTNPYYVFQTTDERQQTTKYYRYTNTGYVYQIDYPDHSHEYFTYTSPFSGPYSSYYKIQTYTNRLGAIFTFNYGQNDDGNGPADLLKSVQRVYKDAWNASHTETITYSYRSYDRVKSVRDQNQVIETYSYDPRGHVTQVTHTSDVANNSNPPAVNYGYDDDGNCTSITDENNHTTIINYDGYRRITKVTVPVNAPAANSTQNILSRFRAYAYDRRDNSDNPLGTSQTHTANNWSVSWLPSGAAIQRIFSPNNWLTDEYRGMEVNVTDNPVVPSSGDGAVHTNATYNVLGQPTAATDAEGATATFSYDTYNRPWYATDPLGWCQPYYLTHLLCGWREV